MEKEQQAGGFVVNIYTSGNQIIQTQNNTYNGTVYQGYRPKLLADDVTKEGLARRPEGESQPPLCDTPKVLESKKARRILDHAVEEGLLTEDYQRPEDMEWWKMACMADVIGDELGLPNKWVVFCQFWGNDNLRKYNTDKKGLTDYNKFRKNLLTTII